MFKFFMIVDDSLTRHLIVNDSFFGICFPPNLAQLVVNHLCSIIAATTKMVAVLSVYWIHRFKMTRKMTNQENNGSEESIA